MPVRLLRRVRTDEQPEEPTISRLGLLPRHEVARIGTRGRFGDNNAVATLNDGSSWEWFRPGSHPGRECGMEVNDG